MIKVLCQTMTNDNDSSLKVQIMEYPNLDLFKEEILKHYPKIRVSLPEEHDEFWFGIQYGDTSDGFWFRWLMAIVDTERGCLYSRGDEECVRHLGLPSKKQHCSKDVYELLKYLKNKIAQEKQNITFVD